MTPWFVDGSDENGAGLVLYALYIMGRYYGLISRVRVNERE